MKREPGLFSPATPAAPARTSEDFERLVLPHREAGHRLARWVLHHEQDAEDCVQESLFRAYRAFAQFRGTDAKGWFLAIVRHACYHQLKQRKRAGPPTPFDEFIHGWEESPRSGAPGEGDSLARGLLPKVLDRLPPETRTIIVLREIEGRTYKDIRSKMGIPIGTVMSRLARGRIRLQQEVRWVLRQTPVFDGGQAA